MRRLTWIAFAALGLIWGSNFIFMKWASALITPLQIVFLRVLAGFVPILVLAVARGDMRPRDLRHWPHFLVMSILATTLYYYAFAKGTSLLPSSVAGMLSGAIPLFTFLTTLIFFRQERVILRKGIGIAFGFAGVAMIARPWSTGTNSLNLLGIASMLLGSLSLGCSFAYSRRFLVKLGLSPIALSAYQMGFALILLTAVTPFHGIAAITSDSKSLLGLLLGLGLTGTGLAYILYYRLVQEMGAISASSVTFVPPPVALLIGLSFAGESMRALDVVAMVSILLGVFAIQFDRGPSRLRIPLQMPRLP
jgi:drug/metabolite transporter (DMT)-like permease